MNVYQVMSQDLRLEMKQKLTFLGTSVLRNSVDPPKPNNTFSLLSKKLISPNIHPIESKAFQNHVSLIRSKTEKINDYLQKHQTLIISLNNPIKHYFDKLMKILVVYSVIASLYFLAFNNNNPESEPFDLFVWALFIIDFCLNFVSEVRDKKKRRVRNLKIIFKKYAKSWMCVDFFALLPLHFVGQPNTEHFLRLLRTLKMNQIYSLLDIVKISKHIARMLYKPNTKNYKQMVLKVIHVWEIVKQVIMMFFMTYFLACIWYYYVNLIIRREIEANNFDKNFGLIGGSDLDNFIKTWYFIFTTLATVGYGDYYATNKYEMGFDVIIMLAGSTWFAFMMGKSINIVNTLQDLSGTNHKKIDLQLWVYFIEQKCQVLPSQLKSRIFSYFSNYWKYDRLKSLENLSDETKIDFFRTDDKLFRCLPKSMKKQIFNYIFSDVFYQYCHFFNYLGPRKYEICTFLRPICYNKEDVIIPIGEKINEVLFVLKGSVEVGVNTHEGFRSIGFLHKNLVVGDYYAVRNEKSPAVFRAFDYLRGYAFPAYVLIELLDKYDIDPTAYLDLHTKHYNRLKEEAELIFSSEIVTSEEHFVERNEGRKSSLLLKTLFKPEYLQACMSTDSSLEVCRVKESVKVIKKKIRETDEMRKVLIGQVKEKLVENIFTRNSGGEFL